MKKIIPHKDFIVMQIPRVDSSISLPDGVRVNRDAFLVVTAIGPDVKVVVVGDRVVIVPQAVMKVVVDQAESFIAKEEFVMGVIAEEATE